MSTIAWVGLVWLYLLGFFGMLGVPKVLKERMTTSKPAHKRLAQVVIGLSILAIVAVWSSSSFAWATAVLVILIIGKVADYAFFTCSFKRGYRIWSRRDVLLDAFWMIGEIILVSLLAFA